MSEQFNRIVAGVEWAYCPVGCDWHAGTRAVRLKLEWASVRGDAWTATLKTGRGRLPDVTLTVNNLKTMRGAAFKLVNLARKMGVYV